MVLYVCLCVMSNSRSFGVKAPASEGLTFESDSEVPIYNLNSRKQTLIFHAFLYHFFIILICILCCLRLQYARKFSWELSAGKNIFKEGSWTKCQEIWWFTFRKYIKDHIYFLVGYVLYIANTVFWCLSTSLLCLEINYVRPVLTLWGRIQFLRCVFTRMCIARNAQQRVATPPCGIRAICKGWRRLGVEKTLVCVFFATTEFIWSFWPFLEFRKASGQGMSL